MNRVCSTCKWKYETEHAIGCNSPSPDRAKWAEYHHVYEPCDIWEPTPPTETKTNEQKEEP